MVKFSELTELIESSFYDKKDLFLYGTELPSAEELFALSAECKTAVALPSKLRPSAKDGITVCGGDRTHINPDSRLVFFDVSLISDCGFSSELIEWGIKRLVVPFAGLADEAEYGYSGRYALLGEMRRQATFYIQLVALFPRKYSAESFSFLYGVSDGIVFDSGESREYSVIKTNGKTDSFGLIFKEIFKKAGYTSFIYFPDRKTVSDFSAYCASRGEYVPVVTGASTCAEIKQRVSELSSGKCRALAGTKSLMSVYLLKKADNAIIFGVPFSSDCLQRFGLTAEKVKVVFSEEDYIRSVSLIKEYCEKYVPVFYDRTYQEKINRLNILYNKIC